MRTLYHFPTSVFSKRARLALAHKALDVELRDARAEPAHLAEAKKLSPQGTMPVLVDDGRALGDSTAIAHWLDVAYPDGPRLFPGQAELAQRALTITSLVDAALNTVVDLGTRYYELRHDAAWDEVRRARIGRAQDAIDAVAAAATAPFLAGDAWSAADIWALTAARWVEALPARAPSFPPAAQIVSLGFRLPDALVGWARAHDSRADVRSVYADAG